MKDSIVEAYYDMSHCKSAAQLGKGIPVADMGMSGRRNTSLTEERLSVSALHDFINTTEPKYRDYGNVIGRTTNSDYDHVFHDEKLIQKHKQNFDRVDYNNIHELVTGGLETHNSGSNHINDHLIKMHRSGNPPPTEMIHLQNPDDHESEDGNPRKIDLTSIDNTLKKNKLEKSMKTYHGASFDPRSLVGEKGLLHLPGYTSSSARRYAAYRYGKSAADISKSKDIHIIEIHHPKGSTNAYIGDDDDYTPFHGDNEMLSPRGITLKFAKEPTMYKMHNGYTVHVHHARRLIGLEK